MPSDEHLTQEELATVLRRAAQLDPDPAGAAPVSDRLPLEAVEAAAAEVGLAPEAVRRAVAELRAGLLEEPEEVPPGAAVVARVVPCDPATALRAADRFLADQSFARVRDQGPRRLYRRRDDVVAKVSRAVDLGGRVRLGAVGDVAVRAVPVEHGTLLQLRFLLAGPYRRAPVVAGASVGVTGFVIGAIGIAALGDPNVLAVAAGLPVGAVAGGASYGVGRAVRAREVRRAREALEGLLDDIEHGREVRPASPLGRLREQAERHLRRR